MTSLREGSTLAEIAAGEGQVRGRAEGRARGGCEGRPRPRPCEDGRLTAAQQAEILADLPDRIDDLVNGDLGRERGRSRPGGGLRRHRARRPAPAAIA